MIILDILMLALLLIVWKFSTGVLLAIMLDVIIILLALDIACYFKKLDYSIIGKTLDIFRLLLLFLLGGMTSVIRNFGLKGMIGMVVGSVWMLSFSLLTGYFLLRALTPFSTKQSSSFSVLRILKLLLATLFIYLIWSILGGLEATIK